jgi:glycosyltransferase involved in cell wall biosynthesis
MSTVIIIPAYNEERTVSWVVERAKKYGKVIVIDDASTDRTAEFAKKAGAIVVTNKVNKGLGYSLRTGFSKALETRHDVIITMDADGQHSPEDIPKLVKKIWKGYDFVLGSRNLSRYPFIKKFGNLFLNIVTNFIAGTSLKDTESGLRAFSRKALEKFYLKANRYEIAVEILFEVGKHNLKACNVEVDSPVYVKGVGISDGIKNFLFLMHRREKTWKDYLVDVRYVLRKNIHRN